MSYDNVCGKKQYDTKKDAVTMMNYLHNKGRERFLRVYQCHNHWHLSRQMTYKIYQGKTNKSKSYETTRKSDFNE